MRLVESDPPSSEATISGATVFRRIAFVAVPALFVAILVVAVVRSGPKSVVGTEAPDFTLQAVRPGEAAISSQKLRGKPAVVNFFASWCISCRTEARLLERTWQEFRDEGLIVLGITYQDAAEDSLDFIERFGLTYPVARDPNQEVAFQFGVLGVPETFFIDHRWAFAAIGTARQIGTRGKTVIYGPISSALLRSQVELLLEQAPGKRN